MAAVARGDQAARRLGGTSEGLRSEFMTEIAVAFDEVSKSFGSFQAVKSLSFGIRKGELVSLLGPSGCGKTTTLRMIAGLEMPSSGHVIIGGRDVSQVPANKRSIGMVFQSYALFPHLNILENVAYGLIAQKMRKSEAHERARAQLEQLGLGHLADRLPSELSGGQQQRAAVGRALVLGPDVLLFDEPLSNLDAKLRRQVREEIRDLQQRLGLTVVYVTHDQSEALAISDRIFLMRQGKIAQSGTPSELYDAPNSEFVADFMGDANVVVLRTGPEGSVRLGDLSVPSGAGADVAMAVVLRPEHLTISPGQGPGLAGTVRRASYLGALIEYRVETEHGPLLVVDRNPGRTIAEGSPVHLGMDAERVRLIPV